MADQREQLPRSILRLSFEKHAVVCFGLSQRIESGGHINESLVYFFGGACGIVLGVAYLIIVALYAPIGAPPMSVDALLLYLAKNSSRWWWIIALSATTDFLFIPFAASIYFALRNVNRYLVWLAAACMILFVFLDLAVTWTNYATAMTLGNAYLEAATEIQKSAILTAAEPVGAVLHSKLLFVYNSLTLAAGILLTGIVMLRSTFGKATAYVGIATGCAGVLAVVGSFLTIALNSAIIVASCLTTLWVVIVGYQFCRLGITARIPNYVEHSD
jgi:hypothetical protein